MPRWKTTAEKEVAKFAITSKKTTEIFIKRWTERNNGSREGALKRLKELGIEFSQLPE